MSAYGESRPSLNTFPEANPSRMYQIFYLLILYISPYAGYSYAAGPARAYSRPAPPESRVAEPRPVLGADIARPPAVAAPGCARRRGASRRGQER